MKITAKQVNPAIQESPLYYEDEFYPEDLIVTGNSRFTGHNDEEYEDVVSRYDEAAEYYDCLKIDKKNSLYKNVTEIINDYFPYSEYRAKPYSTRDIHRIAETLSAYGTNDYYTGKIFVEVFSALTGKEWCKREIHGCCQGEWQNVIYPLGEFSEKDIEIFETEYFNDGVEFVVCEDEDRENSCNYYLHGFTEDEIIQELKEITGADEVEIEMYD